ncbi:MAG: copper-binding protein [Thaumarchaeota archaeon]|nr:copper-binding protein [Nitrososphaerota archaeon]
MVSIDKAAIVLTMAIVAIALGVAASGDMTQDADPAVFTPSTVSTETSEPETSSFGADLDAEIMEKAENPLKSGWERTTSMLDPGVGHETHQIAILLAPSDKVYSGTLNYDASESIQLITLHGPLANGEDKGQAIWTPDGETKFALTFVNPNNAKGEWEFAGNALAVHTMNTEPFTVDYKIDYTEKRMSDTVVTSTTMSMLDPGMGHESHQIAILLAPSSDVYSGIISYTASENIQLVTLRGPIGADEKPAKTWTPDGETIFELTFVDPKNAMGSWEFSGNALAVHTMYTNQFTVSYSISATATAGQTIEVEDKADMKDTSEPQTIHVEIPVATSVPGCEETNSCYSPADVTIKAGDTVHWMNVDTAAHTVTGGSPADGPSGVFDSSLVMADAVYAFTFDEIGSYDYFCMVHPWMTGTVTVN